MNNLVEGAFRPIVLRKSGQLLPRPAASGPLRLATLALLLMLTACQGRLPVERIPRMQWLILPLRQPPAMRTTPRAIQGWWLGAKTIRQNPRAGQQTAELLGRQLAQLEAVNLFSTIDLRYYFGEKRQALEEAYPYLDTEEIQNLLDEVPPLRYGRELGADRVLSGRIIELYMAENRTVHWWWSHGEIEFELINVATGEVEWQKTYEETRQFASQTTILEELTDRAVEDLTDEVLWPLAR